METTTIQLQLGAMCPDIHEQLDEAGMKYNKEEIRICQKIADGISLLHIKGYIGDRVSDTARAKLAREVRKHIKKA